MNVQEFLNNWKSEQKIGIWTANKLECSVYQNEELFLIIVKLVVKIQPNSTITIIKNRLFQTAYDTLSKEQQLDSNFDENVLVNILEDLEKQLKGELTYLGL